MQLERSKRKLPKKGKSLKEKKKVVTNLNLYLSAEGGYGLYSDGNELYSGML